MAVTILNTPGRSHLAALTSFPSKAPSQVWLFQIVFESISSYSSPRAIYFLVTCVEGINSNASGFDNRRDGASLFLDN